MMTNHLFAAPARPSNYLQFYSYLQRILLAYPARMRYTHCLNCLSFALQQMQSPGPTDSPPGILPIEQICCL
jgi:hypothetical protein